MASSEVAHADGTVTDTWSNGHTSVSVAGLPGMTVSIVRSAMGAGANAKKALGALVTSPAIDKANVNAVRHLIASYLAAHRSVLEDAINSGMDPKEAQVRFGSTPATRPVPIIARPRVPTGTGLSGGVPHVIVKTPGQLGNHQVGGGKLETYPSDGGGGGPILASFCLTVNGDGGKVVTTGCEVQKMDQQNGGDWYVADEFQATGVSHDDCSWCFTADRLTQIYSDIQYPSGNQFVRWQPGSTAHEPDSCNSVTVGVSYVFSYSETANICSNSFGPHNLVNSSAGPRFGAVWNGQEPDANWYEATEGVDVLHSPQNASSSVSLIVSESWNS